ncbi:hypothetical protein [Clostridioides difficile]|uniref:hypothetical protein n=1 Tax=Clostridioides difficile TaxID=1496 RepID=UPI0007BB85B7|nr:hypothetical protein [Clostridioides difficile]CZR81528.1 hypothetical protein CDFC105_53056 [Clostridioides difficile]
MSKNEMRIQRFGITEKKIRKGYCNTALLVLILIVVICVITLGVQTHIQNSIGELSIQNDSNNLNATWIGSLASYWGGILGGIISGLLTFIGVAWTIKYYRNSDLIKSRLERMPFLRIELKEYTGKKIDGIELYEIGIKKIEESHNSEVENFYYRMRVKNIGQGFANTLVIYTGENAGGIAYNKLIQVDDSSEFCFKVHMIKDVSKKDVPKYELNFAVRYIDCMTNEYVQRYKIKCEGKNHNDIKIDTGYPTFVGQTHAIGKA